MRIYTYIEVCNKCLRQGKNITDLYQLIEGPGGRKGWIEKQTRLVVKKVQKYEYN